jgi:hypothetical protein
MITASDIFTTVRSQLDDDNSGRYTEAADLVPAINKAILYLVAIFNIAFDQKKISPESLRELNKNRVLDCTGTTTKKISLAGVTDIWTILGVDPDPILNGTNLGDTRNRWATRMSMEEWNDALADPFSAGSGVLIPSSLVRPGYIGPGDFQGDGNLYIFVRPGSIFTANKAALWYIKNPTIVTNGASQIEFPRSLFNILSEKTLYYLSYQQGPDSPYGKITEKEISQVLTLMLS